MLLTLTEYWRLGNRDQTIFQWGLMSSTINRVDECVINLTAAGVKIRIEVTGPLEVSLSGFIPRFSTSLRYFTNAVIQVHTLPTFGKTAYE